MTHKPTTPNLDILATIDRKDAERRIARVTDLLYDAGADHSPTFATEAWAIADRAAARRIEHLRTERERKRNPHESDFWMAVLIIRDALSAVGTPDGTDSCTDYEQLEGHIAMYDNPAAFDESAEPPYHPDQVEMALRMVQAAAEAAGETRPQVQDSARTIQEPRSWRS